MTVIGIIEALTVDVVLLKCIGELTEKGKLDTFRSPDIPAMLGLLFELLK